MYVRAHLTPDCIRHVASVHSLIVASHVDYGESGIFIAELHVSIGCDGGVVLQPFIGQRCAIGHRAHEDYCVIKFHQIGCICPQSHIRNRNCGEETKKQVIS